MLESEVVVITPAGMLDAATASELLEAVQRHLAHTNRIVIDLACVTGADAAGLGALVRAVKAARDAGGDLVLTRPPQPVAALMSECGLDQVLFLASDVPAARARLSES